ncbi:MAG: alpha/beta hydrolase [Campylobacteraceae bacterium]|nr:alpha/beta hydrolase [Campylobacteraceae bacterium]
MKKLLFTLSLFIYCLNAQFIKEPIFNEASYVKTYGNPKHEAIVFVHGLGKEASSIWLQTVEALKKDYYILIFDLPGFGKSDKSNKLYSPDKYIGFIDTLIDNFVDKPFHLVGHSMGASIGLKYTSIHQERVKSLTLIDAAGILHKVAYSEFLVKYKVKEKTKSDAISDFVSELPQVIDSIMPFEVDTMLNSKVSRKVILRSNPNTIAAMALAEEDFSTIPQKIKVPTLIIWGEDDKTAPPRTGYALYKLIKNSKLEIIPNSKHTPMVDNFDIYLTLLKKQFKTKKYLKEEKKLTPSSREVVIRNDENRILRGYFKKVEIHDSKEIDIKDAFIEELIIDNSKVDILNSKLDLKKSSFIINSEVQMTATSIIIDKPIEINNSDFDLAAVDIKLKTKGFYTRSNKKQEIVYSLCTVNSQPRHGVFTVGYF